MLRLGGCTTLGTILRRRNDLLRYSSSSPPTHHPNAPLDLDPAFQALLRDVDISLSNKYSESSSEIHKPRELEVYPHDPDTPKNYLTSAELDARDDIPSRKDSRKSPAAAFGSQRIRAVVLPLELQSSIERMIASESPLNPSSTGYS